MTIYFYKICVLEAAPNLQHGRLPAGSSDFTRCFGVYPIAPRVTRGDAKASTLWQIFKTKQHLEGVYRWGYFTYLWMEKLAWALSIMAACIFSTTLRMSKRPSPSRGGLPLRLVTSSASHARSCCLTCRIIREEDEIGGEGVEYSAGRFAEHKSK